MNAAVAKRRKSHRHPSFDEFSVIGGVKWEDVSNLYSSFSKGDSLSRGIKEHFLDSYLDTDYLHAALR